MKVVMMKRNERRKRGIPKNGTQGGCIVAMTARNFE